MADQRNWRDASTLPSHEGAPDDAPWTFGFADAVAQDVVPSDTQSAGAQSWQAAPPASLSDVTAGQQIVFIEGNVPDAQLLAAGVAPGVQAVILDADQDGVQQIAAYLTSHSIQKLAAIDIVAHGADGELQFGTAQLDSATIGQYQADLATIGAALRPGGDIQLYGCDVAQDAAGDAFLQQLSEATGGANIAASSHLIGPAAEGGSWNLNVDVGTVDAAGPFTATAVSAYPDVLSLTDDQIVFTTWNGATGAEGAGNRVEQFGVSGSMFISGSTIDLADGTQSDDNGVNFTTSGVAVDTALNEYFVASDNVETHALTIEKGNLTGPGGLSDVYTNPLPDADSNTSGTFVIPGALAVDAQTNELYFAQAAENGLTGATVAADTGIYEASITSGPSLTPALLTSTSVGLVNPDFLVLDPSANLLFFDDSIEALDGFPATDNLDEVNLSTGSVTVMESFFSSTDSVDLMQGLALNGNTIYLTTVDYGSSTSDNNAILAIPFTVSGSGSTANATVGTATTLYHGPGADQPSDIVIDAAQGIFYTTGEEPASVGGSSGDVATVFEGGLSGGSSLTPVLSMTSVTGPLTSTSSPAFDTNDPQLVLLTQPTITASGTVTADTGGSAVTVDSGITVSDQDGQNLASATVTGALTGDTLSFNNGNVFTFGDGDQISNSFSSGTLTLNGDATVADYQSALDAVTFATTSTSATPRTIGWTVSDGVVASATADSTVDVHIPPVVIAGAAATFDGGGTAVQLDGGLTVTDTSSSTLASAKVVIGGFIAGDMLVVGAPSGLGTTFTNGTLTLSGLANLGTYQTALESITYIFASGGDPTGGGSHTTRTIDWTVNDGVLSSGTATSTLDLVHEPPTVTAGASATYPEGGAPVVLDPNVTVTDPDSGSNLVGASVTISGVLSTDLLNFTTQNGISGSYTAGSGELTLTGTTTIGNYDAALSSITYSNTGDPTNGGADANRTISWVVNDGAADSAAADSSLTTLCFCAGTGIATPRGEVAVQSLAVGDTVLTASGTPRKIIWIGVGRVRVTRGRRSAATPVIVHKGALADNVPHHDLRVSKGHALCLDEVLIPVEFLVNHRSIVWDDRAGEVSLYHVELDTHDVLLANGAPAESYRDDGNRWLFQNANSGWDLPPLAPCRPVLTGGPVVDAAWRRLLDRAGARPGVPLTDDPDLHLLVDGGRIDHRSHPNGRWVFPLSGTPGQVRIVSHAVVPAEFGLARDARPLGVAIRRIAFWQGAAVRMLDAADPRLAVGFHSFEPDNGYRWTDGDAEVPAELFAGTNGPFRLELELAETTRYPLLAAA
jgi:hypothetical protein